jgi:hypothetical protein
MQCHSRVIIKQINLIKYKFQPLKNNNIHFTLNSMTLIKNN